jgi:hypothetical protein
MRKTLIIFIIIVVLLNLFKGERVFYTPINIPGKQMAITIPPFGMFIEREFKKEGSGRGTLLRHERVHWSQYKKMGLFGFYSKYFSEYVKYGRFYGSMEREARKLSK